MTDICYQIPDKDSLDTLSDVELKAIQRSWERERTKHQTAVTQCDEVLSRIKTISQERDGVG